MLQLSHGIQSPDLSANLQHLQRPRWEEYFVQDLTESFFDAAVDFIVKNHAMGAIFHRAAGTLVDNGIERVSEMYRNVIKRKVSLICFKKETREIAGLNALIVKTRSDIPKVEARVTLNLITTLIKNYFSFRSRTAKACSDLLLL